MQKTLLLGCLAVMALASTAFAQIDPDPDGVGIYFDEAAYVYCTDAEVGTQLTAYLCFTRISSSSGIGRWESKIEVSDPAAILGWALRGQATNSTMAPEFAVQLAEPLPYVSSLVVLEIELQVMNGYPLALRVWPVSDPTVMIGGYGLPGYATGDDPEDFRTLGYSWGWDQTTGTPYWCTVVNPVGSCDDPPTATPTRTWGGIKALYR
jgi:hypothetical protein